MPHRADIGHLTVQNIPVNDLALGTLASRTVLSLTSIFQTTLKNTFLVKKIRYYLHVGGLTNGQGDNLLICIARGDATASEVGSAFTEVNTVGPADTTQVRTSDNIWNIWQSTVRNMIARGTADNATLIEEISLGKGMPALSEVGILPFVFNNDGTALDTGGVINGVVQYWGVWLRD